MAKKKRKDLTDMNRKELTSFFEELYEKLKLRNNTLRQINSLENDLAQLKPKKEKFHSIVDFINNNLILKIIFIGLAITFTILLEVFLEFLFGTKLSVMSFLLSIGVCGVVYFIYYKRQWSKTGAIFLLIISAAILHIFKVVDINDFFSTIVMLLLSILLSLVICLLICAIWFGINFSKFLSTKNQKNQENLNWYEEKKASIIDLISSLEEELAQMQKEIDLLTNGELYNGYLSEYVLDLFIKYLKSGRCDSLKECTNLLEEEMRQEERDRYMREARERELEMQQKELSIKEQMKEEQNQLFKDIRDEMGKVRENSEFQKEFTKNKVYKYGTNSDLRAMQDAERKAQRNR